MSVIRMSTQIACVLVCEGLARGYATLCYSCRAIVPVGAILKLVRMRRRTQRSVRTLTHKTVPMNGSSIREVILDADDKAVALISFYGWSRVGT